MREDPYYGNRRRPKIAYKKYAIGGAVPTAGKQHPQGLGDTSDKESLRHRDNPFSIAHTPRKK